MNCNWLHNIFFQKDAANINNFLIGTAKNDINVIFICILLIHHKCFFLLPLHKTLNKDKSLERMSSGILSEEVTHFSDAVDKIVWTKFGAKLKGEKEYLSVMRIGR